MGGRRGTPMQSLDSYASQKLLDLEARDLRRRLTPSLRENAVEIVRNGRRLVSFCCNDYLNLSQHPAVKQAAIAAVETFGAGAGASRLVTGDHPLLGQLETRLAAFKQTDDACVFGSGYLTNLGVIPTLVGAQDLILADILSHACILSGAKLSGARVEIFKHNDLAHLETLLAAERAAHRHALIVTDGVFSMDGDLAPVSALAELAARFDAWLMIDDAHGIGVVGGGRGSTFLHGKRAEVPLQMGTLSKAVGSYGGYLCASRPVIDLVRTRARPFIYSTGLPPAAVGASIKALEIIEHDAALVAAPMQNARIFTSLLNLPAPESCIVPIMLGEAGRALEASKMLEDEGFLVIAIRPPTVPAGTARLRFTFTARHKREDIERLAAAVRRKVLNP